MGQRLFLVGLVLLALGFMGLRLSGCAVTRDNDVMVPHPSERGPDIGKRALRSIELLKRNAGRAVFSPDDRYITYHSKGDGKYYEIYKMKADGSDVTCLTCDSPELPDKNKGQPWWHPSGKWIVFQAEKEHHVLPRFSLLAIPGIGYENDVWIMTPDGKTVYRLTDLKTKERLFQPTPITGVLQPHFSKEGDRVSWSEKIGDEGPWGNWDIRVYDFNLKGETPGIDNLRVFTPGVNKEYYESNDFMPGDREMLICGNLESDQTVFGIDIYYLETATGKTRRLTHSLDVFDECPHESPDGSHIAYLSSEGFEKRQDEKGPWWEWMRGEFWLMDANGNGKTRLTYFNAPGYPEYSGHRVMPAFIAWHSTGDKLLLSVSVEMEKLRMEDQIWIAELR